MTHQYLAAKTYHGKAYKVPDLSDGVQLQGIRRNSLIIYLCTNHVQTL